MSNTYFHSTPIYYVNDVPHPGHAYTTVAADALARARRLEGKDVFFLTGTDEHGQNIERIAREKGIPEQEYCDQISARFRQLWERLDIRYDRFIRTTDDVHKRGVLALWARMRNAKAPNGETAIYKGTYAGFYCPRCEAFKDESELRQPGNICPDHERACEWTEEQNFFFRLSAFSVWLQDEIESNRIQIEPPGRRNEVLAVLRDGLKDFSISRARVKWGIPVPEEPAHVFYVWMDALSNYVTALGIADGLPDYAKYWEGAVERLHFIGKEIIRFHCLYWPAMLHAAGVPPPTRLFAHGWLTKNGKKISKTTGNIIDPDALLDRFGSDAFRYFFLREGSFGQDWDFTEDAFVGRFNSDLANDLGNLVSRALTMAARYCDGTVPKRPALPEGSDGSGWEIGLQGDGGHFASAAFERYNALDYAGALSGLWAGVSALNQRIVEVSPWTLAKDPTRRPELDTFLYRLLEAIRLIAVLASPVLPTAATRIFAMLGQAAAPIGPADVAWGRLEPGSRLGEIVPLFPRIDTLTKERPVSDDKTAVPPAAAPMATPAAPLAGTIDPAASASPALPPKEAAPAQAASTPDLIGIDDFAKMELKVAKVTAAERIKGSKKLLKLQVDLGTESRQIVSGIADAYEPEALVGQTVVLVANLKPAKLMGVESHGMVLAASIDGKAVLCGFAREVPPGTKVK